MAKKKSIIEEAKELVEEAVEKVEDAVEETAEKITKKVKKVEKEIVKDVKELVEEKSETKKTAKEKLLEKAKALAKGIEEVKDIDLKKEMKPEDGEKKDALVPIDDYLKASIHLGTKVITPDMKSYVYRRRADGLAVFNTALLDDKIKEGAQFLAQYAPEDIIVICKREAGWKAVKKFAYDDDIF